MSYPVHHILDISELTDSLQHGTPGTGINVYFVLTDWLLMNYSNRDYILKKKHGSNISIYEWIIIIFQRYNIEDGTEPSQSFVGEFVVTK